MALALPRPTSRNAQQILSFWFEDTKPYQWYRRDLAFDQLIRERFSALHKAAVARRLDAWRAHPHHALALIILLDQFSRNMFRGDPRSFAQDGLAVDVARDAITRRYDRLYGSRERAFFYMPFMHAEDLDIQRKSIALFKARCMDNIPHACEHHDIIKRFGRFPHRNKTLGRVSTPEEIAFLKAGGFNP